MVSDIWSSISEATVRAKTNTSLHPRTTPARTTKSKAAPSSDSRKAFFVNLTDTALTMATEKPTFSPAWTEPLSNFFTLESRIRQLREMLLDKSLEFQKENILLVIHLYETGQLPPKRAWETTWILNGKAVDELPDEIPMNSVVWAEVCLTSILYYYFTYLTPSVSIVCSLCRPLRHRR